MKQETLEEATENSFLANKLENSNAVEKANYIAGFREGVKWQQEQIGKSELIQRIRASKSDAEARRIIRTI
jgi:hypothetical protein